MDSERNDLVSVSAQALLEEFGLDCGTKLDEVASRLGLQVREVAATSFDGALLRVVGRPLGTVVLRSDIAEPGRRRFTLAHEIGHYLLPNQQEDLATPCRPSSIESWDRSLSSRELDANRFAAEILMPRQLLGESLRQPPSVSIARAVAERFQTSLTAATFRLVELSTFRIAMVVSREGAARWYRASDEFGRAVRIGPLDPRTLAHDLFTGHPAAEASGVPADAWLFEQNLRDDSTVWEHSILLRSYGVVLSLLEIRDRVERQTDYDDEPIEELDPAEFTLARKKWPRR